MTTLKDIAGLTGVSVNTVSRALRDMPDIGEATKDRIRRAANTLGYTPNAVARGLVLKRTFIIGALVTEIKNPSRSALLQALRELLMPEGYHLLIESYDADSEVAARIREMTSRGIDGLLLGNIDGILAEKEYWPELQSVIKGGVPVVTFFNAITSKIPRVNLDHTSIAEQLTRHLIDTHRLSDIRYVGGENQCSRATGYRTAMENAGLTDRVRFIPLPYWSLPETRDGIVGQIKKHGAPEGIVCHNDLTAIAVIAGLRKAGLRVPEDIAVVGTDNIEIAEFMHPTLSTAGIDPQVLAKKLFTLLTDQLNTQETSQAQSVELDFLLFFRESCGCTQANH